MGWFEDYQPGMEREFGGVEVTEDTILAFAREYDPQPFHVDRAAAAASPYGGLIASGWQTAALMMKMFVANMTDREASLGSPGIDELRWTRPVRPGDVLRVRARVVDARPSRSKPDRGSVFFEIAVVNQRGETVMTAKPIGMYLRRPPTR